MQVQIDILTVVFVLSCINLISALFFGVHLRMTQSKSKIIYFIVSKVLQGLSWLLRLLFYTQPHSMFILLSDLTLVCGFASESVLFVDFLGKFKGKTRIFYWASMIFSLILIGILWPLSETAKNLVSLLCYLTYMSIVAKHLLFSKESTLFQRLLGFIYAVLPTVSVVLYVSITDEVTALGSVTSISGILYYISIIFMQMVGSVGYLLMVKEVDERTLLELASKDALTGILNRKAFYDRANVQHLYATQHYQPLSFAIIDIDHFKNVNDTYGHQAGDQVLIHLTHVLFTSIRKEDILARFGGEEFVICFPRVTQQEIIPIFQRVQAHLNQEWHAHHNDKLPNITLSVGIVSGIPSPQDTIDLMLKQADDCLYYCKNNGRNCMTHMTLNAPATLTQAFYN